MEHWKPVPGFKWYAVSDRGNLWSLRTGQSNYGGKMRARRHSMGYRIVSLRGSSTYSVKFVHRLVLEAFVGPCPDGHECAHLDGTRDNNRLENLAWVTHKENCSHKTAHGTAQRGENHPMAGISEASVRAIRAKYRNGVPGAHSRAVVSALAAEHDTTESTVRCIIKCNSWRHIQ